MHSISGIGPSGAKTEYSQGPLVGNWIEDNVVIRLGGAGACQPFERHWPVPVESMTQARTIPPEAARYVSSPENAVLAERMDR